MLCAQSCIEESMAVKPFVPQSAILGVRRCTPDWRSTRVLGGALFEYAQCEDSSIRHCTSSALGFMVSEDDFDALFHLIQRQTDFSRFSQLMSDPAGLRRTCRHPTGCCSFADELCIWICNESLEQILRRHCLGPTEASNTEPSDRTMTAGKRPLQNVISSLDSTKLAGDEICPDRAQMTSMSVWGPNTTSFRCATFNQQGPAFNQQTPKMTTGTMVYRKRGIPQTLDGMLPVVSCWHAWRGPGASDLLHETLRALTCMFSITYEFTGEADGWHFRQQLLEPAVIAAFMSAKDFCMLRPYKDDWLTSYSPRDAESIRTSQNERNDDAMLQQKQASNAFYIAAGNTAFALDAQALMRKR